MDLTSILEDFGGITAQYISPTTIEVGIPDGETYRLDISKTSNENAPWHVAASFYRTTFGWRTIEEFPEVDEREEESAIRFAFSFLQDISN